MVGSITAPQGRWIGSCWLRKHETQGRTGTWVEA
jgi:hypothetical protein